MICDEQKCGLESVYGRAESLAIHLQLFPIVLNLMKKRLYIKITYLFNMYIGNILHAASFHQLK